MEALKAVGVCRKYGSQEVLKDFSLSVGEGAFVALMGPSGSGKSTFLHLAAGLLTADAGEILVGGKDVVRMGDAEVTKFRRRHVGVVFQAFNLLNALTARENILMPLRLESRRCANDAAVQARLTELSEKLGISAILDKKPELLSGGEQQRVAIARALIAAPSVVLADEPTGNLDAQASKETCALLKALNKTQNAAILLVTHDPQVAAAADTVAFLKEGRIAAAYPTAGDPARISELYLETYR